MAKLTPAQKKKKSKGLCITEFCRNKHAPKERRCYKCRTRIYRENNPEKATFQILRDNAKRRGKFFDLTYEQFFAFLNTNPEYMENKGRTKLALHVDRIDNNMGYTAGNLQVLLCTTNVRKQHAYDYKGLDYPVGTDPFDIENDYEKAF